MNLTLAVALCLLVLGIVAAANTRGGLRDRATHRNHLREGVPSTTLCAICYPAKRRTGGTK